MATSSGFEETNLFDFLNPGQELAPKLEPIDTAELNADLMDHLHLVGLISEPKLLKLFKE
jgi:hypothetical protein